MGKFAQWITHHGKQILFVNCAGLDEQECLAALDEMKQALLQHRGGLTLLEFSQSHMTSAVTAKAREVSVAIKAQNLPQAPIAIVGIEGVARSIAELISRTAGRGSKMYFVDNVEAAKEWLVQWEDRSV